MATVQWCGVPLKAKPIRQCDDGSWLMEAIDHGARLQRGVKFRVKTSEIIEMAAAEMPMAPSSAGGVAPLIINPVLPPLSKDNDEMSKLSQLAATAAETHKEIEDGADASLNRLTNARAKAKAGLAKLDKLSDAVEKGISDIEDMANQLSNGGPPLA